MPTVTGRSLKCTVVLDSEALLAVGTPNGQPRTILNVKLADRWLEADLASKSVRKAIAAVHEYGAEGCVAVIQGKLVAGDKLTEAGLVVQQKVAKPVSNTGTVQEART